MLLTRHGADHHVAFGVPESQPPCLLFESRVLWPSYVLFRLLSPSELVIVSPLQGEFSNLTLALLAQQQASLVGPGVLTPYGFDPLAASC